MSWILAAFSGTHHRELRAGDQVMCLENTIKTGFRDKVGGKPEIFGPLTLLGFPVVDPYFLRSIAVKNPLDSYRPANHAA